MKAHINSHNSLFVQEKSSRILNLLRDSYLSISDGDDVLIDKSEYVDDDYNYDDVLIDKSEYVDDGDDEYGKHDDDDDDEDDDDEDDDDEDDDDDEVITV